MDSIRKDREGDIEYWWESACDYPTAVMSETLTKRLFLAFQDVLMHMPAEDVQIFLECDPRIVCQEGIPAAAFSIGQWIPPRAEGERVNIAILYFAPTVGRLNDRNLRDQVAHECAHIVLRHHIVDPLQAHQRVRSEEEMAADHLSQSWGYRPRYTRALLQEIRLGEARDDRQREEVRPANDAR